MLYISILGKCPEQIRAALLDMRCEEIKIAKNKHGLPYRGNGKVYLSGQLPKVTSSPVGIHYEG